MVLHEEFKMPSKVNNERSTSTRTVKHCTTETNRFTAEPQQCKQL